MRCLNGSDHAIFPNVLRHRRELISRRSSGLAVDGLLSDSENKPESQCNSRLAIRTRGEPFFGQTLSRLHKNEPSIHVQFNSRTQLQSRRYQSQS